MYEVCDLHAAREYHKGGIAVCDAFIERVNGERESVLIQLREEAREIIQNNRSSALLWSCVVGRTLLSMVIMAQADMEGVQAASTNHGNFCALLNFRISAGDTILRDHLHSAARNATYTSPQYPESVD